MTTAESTGLTTAEAALDNLRALCAHFPRPAIEAARQAAIEGRLDGEFIAPNGAGCCCVIGHMIAYTGQEPREVLDRLQPGGRCLMPIERFVAPVMGGQRPQTSPRVATILAMLEQCLAEVYDAR